MSGVLWRALRVDSWIAPLIALLVLMPAPARASVAFKTDGVDRIASRNTLAMVRDAVATRIAPRTPAATSRAFATATWTGAVNNLWSNAGNWSGAQPSADNDLVFPSGASNLSTSNDLTAGTSFNSITISGSGYTLAGNSIVLAAGNLTVTNTSGSNTISLAMSFAATRTLSVADASTTLTISGVISGSGSPTKSGAGTLTLSGTNTFTGAMTVSAGTVSVPTVNNASTNGPLGNSASAVSLGSSGQTGTIEYTGSTASSSKPFAVVSGGTGVFQIDNSATALTVSGQLSGLNATSGVTKTGSGTMAITTIVSASAVGWPLVISAGKFSIAGTGYNLLGWPSWPNVTINAGATLSADNTSQNACNIGALTLNGGTLANGTAPDATYGTWVLNGAVTVSGGANTSTINASHVTPGVGPTVFTVSSGASNGIDLDVTGILSSDMVLFPMTKAGAGLMRLSGVNTYTGAITINAGTLKLGATNAINSSSTLSISSGATFDLNTFGETVASITGAGTITSSAAGAVTLTAGGDNSSTTWSGVIQNGSGTVALTKAGTGAMTLSGSNTYTGLTTINHGANSADNAQLILANTSGAAIQGNVQVGNGGLSNTYAVLQMGAANQFGPTSTITHNGSVNNWTYFKLMGYSQTIAGMSDATNTGVFENTEREGSVAAATLTINNSVANSYNGYIRNTNTGTSVGAVSLIKTGTGTLTVSSITTATYTGSTTINGGVLSISADGQLGTAPGSPVAGQLTFGGGTLQTTATFTLSANRGVALNSGGGTFDVASGTGVAYSGIAAGGGGLTKTSAGTLALSGANTYTGATTINAGTLSISADNNLGAVPGSATAGRLTFGGGTLATTASFTLSANRGVALNSGGGTFDVASGTALAYSGIAAGAGGLTKSGAGTLTLTGANTYTGLTTINNGGTNPVSTLLLSNTTGAAIQGNVQIGNNGSGYAFLQMGAANQFGPTTTISNSGSVNNWTFFKLMGYSQTIAGITDATTDGVIENTENEGSVAATLTINNSVANNYNGYIRNTSSGSGVGALSLIKTGAGTLTVSSSTTITTYTGSTTINGGVLSISADGQLGTAPGSPTAGQLAFGGGALAATATFTLSANRGIALNGGGGTFDVASGTTLTYSGIATGTGGLTKTSAGSLALGSATLTMGDFTLSAGTVTAPSATGFAVSGNWSNSGTFTHNSGTVTWNGSSGQTVSGSSTTSFNSLTLNNSSGLTLSTSATVNGVMTFTSGKVTTGSNTLYIATGGSVSRTSGHVIGNFKKYATTGATSLTFEIGDASNYTPVTVAFASVTVAGDLTAKTTAGDHPNIATSNVSGSKSVNRYWTLTNSGITFTNYGVTFTFVAGDIDGGANTAAFIVGKYSGSAWSYPTVGTKTSTSTQITGVTAFSDFQIGETSVYGIAVTSVTASASRLPSSGTNYTTTFTLQNNGNATDSYDLLITRLPGTYLTTVSIAGTSITQGANKDSARVANLGAGALDTATVTYSVAMATNNSLDTLVFKARSVGNSSQTANGRHTMTVVRPLLVIAKTRSPSGTPAPAIDITYSDTVTNNGGQSAASVVLTDSVSTSFEFKVASVVTSFPVGVTVAYSNDAGATWTYTPASGGCSAPAGYDRCVNRIRWTLASPLSNTGSNTGNTQYIVRIR